MASLTIRNLDNDLKARLRLRAARHGCSMEAEVRDILAETLAPPPAEKNLADAIRRRFAPLRGAELSLPPRQQVRTPPDLDE